MVIANVPLVGGGYEGEGDFVVAHPEVGLMVVEVKGGQVGVDPAAGVWFAVDRHGVRHELVPGPFDQAQANAHHLARLRGSLPVTARPRYPFAWAVALPDVHVPGSLGPFPPDVILNHGALLDLRRGLRRAGTALARSRWESRPDGARAVEPQFDAIVVDEAQDFAAEWWLPKMVGDEAGPPLRAQVSPLRPALRLPKFGCASPGLSLPRCWGWMCGRISLLDRHLRERYRLMDALRNRRISGSLTVTMDAMASTASRQATNA